MRRRIVSIDAGAVGRLGAPWRDRLRGAVKRRLPEALLARL